VMAQADAGGASIVSSAGMLLVNERPPRGTSTASGVISKTHPHTSNGH
jgi:hypothetical protein